MDKLRNRKRSKAEMDKGNSKSRHIPKSGIIKGNDTKRRYISIGSRERQRMFNMDVKHICSSAVRNSDTGCLRQPLWRKL